MFRNEFLVSYVFFHRLLFTKKLIRLPVAHAYPYKHRCLEAARAFSKMTIASFILGLMTSLAQVLMRYTYISRYENHTSKQGLESR